ncbi:MAG: hypothetical protein FRX49_09117 [Trebouxia sp. A1-2]|nr:MAG: hypothetical protein FRX49_09117 [Trebouxia sp. A1-2]
MTCIKGIIFTLGDKAQLRLHIIARLVKPVARWQHGAHRPPFRPGRAGSTSVRSAGGTNDNPFITNRGKKDVDEISRLGIELTFAVSPRTWGSVPDDNSSVPKAPSVDTSLSDFGKQQPAKANFPLLTKLLVSAMILLFVYQWWPFLTNFQHQTSFITNAARSRTGPSSFLPALKHLTLGIPEPGHWSHLTVSWMLANCLAIHEFGKDLEAQIGKLQFLAVLVFAAYASGLTMIVTNHPVGAEALLPVGASGLVTGITGTLFVMSLFVKNLRQQGTLESSGAALVIAFVLGQFVPALDNGIHAGGLIGGLAVGIIILIQYGIRGLLGGRKARGAKS